MTYVCRCAKASPKHCDSIALTLHRMVTVPVIEMQDHKKVVLRIVEVLLLLVTGKKGTRTRQSLTVSAAGRMETIQGNSSKRGQHQPCHSRRFWTIWQQALPVESSDRRGERY